MASSSISKRSRTADEREVSAEISVQRATWAILKATVDLDASDLVNPATEIETGIEWSPDGTDWRFVASIVVRGHAENEQAPFLDIGPEWRTFLGAHPSARVRVYLHATRPGAAGVTLEVG